MFNTPVNEILYKLKIIWFAYFVFSFRNWQTQTKIIHNKQDLF